MFDKRQIKVLIVEDDRTSMAVAKSCVTNYTKAFIEKFSAQNAAQAMQIFNREHPDIVLLDIELPDGNGVDLLDQMLNKQEETFVAMVTGSTVKDDVFKSKQRGAKGYIVKPYVVKKIHDILDDGLVYLKHVDELRAAGLIKSHSDKLLDEYSSFEEQNTPEKIMSGWSILFADTNSNNLQKAKEHISKLCKSIDTVSSGSEALELTKQRKYNLIFLNTRLPDINGYTLSKEIRSSTTNDNSQSYIIAISPNADEANNAKWSEAGINHILVEPCPVSKLENIIKKYAK